MHKRSFQKILTLAFSEINVMISTYAYIQHSTCIHKIVMVMAKGYALVVSVYSQGMKDKEKKSTCPIKY